MLGFLQQRLPLVEDSVVEVALRPDDIQVTSAAAGGNGHIVERQFVGIAIIYTIVLADGTHVHSWQPHTLDLAPGMAGFEPVMRVLQTLALPLGHVAKTQTGRYQTCRFLL